jgi:hypothetical protein
MVVLLHSNILTAQVTEIGALSVGVLALRTNADHIIASFNLFYGNRAGWTSREPLIFDKLLI